jgi:radical SAM superfamily enzyme YgiQ (UPF0313 family)
MQPDPRQLVICPHSHEEDVVDTLPAAAGASAPFTVTSGKRIAVIEAGHPRADSLASMFLLLGYGGLVISSVLRREGYEVKYFPMFTSTRLDESFIFNSDYVLISTMVHTARLGYEIADWVRARPGGGPVVIFGGPHPTCEPEDTLAHCDFVVMNEGEETLIELLERLESGGTPDDIAGLTFTRADGSIVYTPRRSAMRNMDLPLDPSVIYDYPGIVGGFLRTGRVRFPFPVVQFSRGCPYACSFCLGMRQLGKEYRTRPAQSVITDLQRLHDLTAFPVAMFHDNDIAIRRNETKDLLREMARRRLPIRRMNAFTRVDSTKDEELWRLFDEAGIANVFFGVESLSQKSLDSYHKGTTVDGIHAAMRRLRDYKVKARIIASFIIGDVDDPIEELALIREFWREYHEQITRVVIQPLMEYPFQQKLRGQHQLYADDRFIHYDWDYFSGDYLVFFPRMVPPSRLQAELLKTFQFVHGVPPCCRWNRDYQVTQAYIRYTHRHKEKNLRRYIEFLEEREAGKYDREGRLIPEALVDDRKPTELGHYLPQSPRRWKRPAGADTARRH